jgi:hypothetical protein
MDFDSSCQHCPNQLPYCHQLPSTPKPQPEFPDTPIKANPAVFAADFTSSPRQLDWPLSSPPHMIALQPDGQVNLPSVPLGESPTVK